MTRKPNSEPSLSARNWRKRAEQLLAIADAGVSEVARESLMRRAAEFLAKAEEIEQDAGKAESPSAE